MAACHRPPGTRCAPRASPALSHPPRPQPRGWQELGTPALSPWDQGCPLDGRVGVWGALTGATDGNCAQQGQGDQQAGPHGTGTLGTPLAPSGHPRALSPSWTPPWALCHLQSHRVLSTSPQKRPHIPTVPFATPSATPCPVPFAIPSATPCPVPSATPSATPQTPALLRPPCAQFLTCNLWVTPSPGHPVPFCPHHVPSTPAPQSPPVPDSGSPSPG